MKFRRVSACCLGLLLVVILPIWFTQRRVLQEAISHDVAAGSARASADVAVPENAGREAERPAVMEDSPEVPEVAYEAPRQPDFSKLDAFDEWKGRWKKATPEERETLVEEGTRLAGERRPEYRALIAFDPRQAVDRAVTRLERQDLPVEITSQLETPVSAVGAYQVLMGRPAPGIEMPGEALVMRSFVTGEMSYKAHVPAELRSVTSIPKTPLQGYADGFDLAVAPNAVRPMEAGEKIPAGTLVQATCPVSGDTTETISSGEAVTQETPTVQIGESVIALCDGAHVAVLQDDYRSYAQASGSGGGGFFMDNYPGTASVAIGAFKCLYIRVIYQDQMSPPNTEENAYNDMRDNARYYIENSYGKMTQTTTFTPLVTLPHSQKWYIDKESAGYQVGLNLVHSDARAAAKALGYDSGQFNCTIVRVNGGPLLSGSSWGGSGKVWLTWGGMDVINHECGHSLGLNHANYWNTSDGTAYGTGSNQEYGNPYDVMGGAYGFSAQYNSISKRQLGWIQPNYFHSPKANGLYRIHAYDQPQLEEGKRYAINVAKDSIRGYNIEYHPARGGLLADQALVLYNGMGTNAGHLLDTTPGTPGGKGDAGIALGRTYSDWESDQHFTVAKNETSPSSLDIIYNRGPFPGNVAPAATLAASATTVLVGGSVTFTATASDANGDPLAYYWQFDDGVYGTNTPVFTRTFDSAAQVNAMLTVSDMKGGSVRRSVVINAGAHGKQSITGVVTNGTDPLQGVMIGNGSKYCYTNADGTYSLPGLATGTTTLTASLPGHSFTPSTANPYTVVSGSNTVNWTSGVPTLVTLTKTADATEGGSSGNFRLTRTEDTAAALTVLVSPVGGTATKTTDYTFAPDYAASGSFKSFTIPAGSATLDVAVAAVNDTGAEGPETITLQVASAAGYLSGASNSVVMTLNDNDTTLPLVSVAAPDPYATEGTGSADTGKFTFTRTGPTTAALNIAVAWSGTATNGTDHTTLPATVTIPVGQSSANLMVTSINDSLIEAPEDVAATISTNAAYLRDIAATSASVVITDDDTPVVTVSVPDPSAAEDGQDTGAVLVTRTGSTSAPLTVYYGATGTASYGTDYAALTGQVTIPAGATSAPVVITPYDDDIGEPAETVVVSLTTFNNGYSVGAAYQGTISVTDDSDPVLVTVRGGTAGTEGGANATVIFHSTGTGSGTVTVNYTVSGTATAGSDYTTLPGTVSVPVNGSNDTTVTIPVTNDASAEPTETVVVTITPGIGYKTYNDPSATAVIRDNDSGNARVIVSTVDQTPSETGPTAANFYFSRPTATTGNLTVNYTVSGTATHGTDYASLSGTVVIPDGSAVASVPVTPVNDTLVEGSETVTVTVVAGTGYSPDFPASATYRITDNDAAAVTVGFQQASVATSEQPSPPTEYRDLPVVLSAASTSTVSVSCVSSGGSAMGDDVDWAFVDADNGNAVVPSMTLTFPPGTTTKNLRIRVKNDGYVEGGEAAVLQLVAPVNADLTAGKGTQTVMIFDDELPVLVTEERWNNSAVYTNNTWDTILPDYTAYHMSFTPAQNVGNGFSRRLAGSIIAPVSGVYNFWIASDDASRLYLSTDATAANKGLIASFASATSFQNWDANASQKSANISLVAGQTYYMEVQHQEIGGNDHVSVAWQGPTFSRKPVTISITDTAPRTVRMLASATTCREGDGSEPMLQVLLDRPAGPTPVTVSYSSSGTATNGSDYTLSAGTVTFDNGEQMKPLPLAILTDSTVEAPESIVVSLSSPTGAALTAPSTHTITLLDHDAPGDGVWANAAGGAWNVHGNWSGGVIAYGSGQTADFSALDLTSNATVSLNGSRTIGNLVFGDTTVSNNWTIAPGSGGALTLEVASGSPLVTVDNGMATLGVSLAGTQGMTKAGEGRLVLTQPVGYSGFTTVDGGTLDVSGAAGILASNAPVKFSGAGTLDLGTRSITLAPVVADGGVGSIASTGTLTWGGSGLTLGGTAANQSQTLDLRGLGNFVFNSAAGTISVGPQLSVTGSEKGYLYLANANTITASALNVGGVAQSPFSADQGSEDAQLYLGQTNTFNVNTFTVGQGGGIRGLVQFGGHLTANPTLTIRGTAGGSSRANITVGNVYDVYTGPTTRFDLASGVAGQSVLDAMVGTLDISSMVANNLSAEFIMGGGTLDATTINVGHVINSPTYNNTFTGRFRLNGGTVKVQTLKISQDDGGTGQAAGELHLNSGTVNAQNITHGNGAAKTFYWNDGTLANYDGFTNLSVSSGISIVLGTGTHTVNIGTGRSGSIASVVTGAGEGLVKAGAGALDLTAANTYTGATVVGGGTLTVSGSLGATTTTVQSGGTLGGTGTLGGAVTVQSGGTLAPGAAGIGTLVVNDDVTLGGNTVMEIGKTGTTLTSDRITGISTAGYGGTLTVTKTGSGMLAAGDSFLLFSAGSYGGAFSGFSLPSLSAGLGWNTSRLAVDGTVSVGSLPVAANDSFTIAEDTSGTFAVLANDTDADGDPLAIQSVTQGAHGSVTISGNNAIYTPAANWNGTDSFTYNVIDSGDGSVTGTVTVTVTPANDAPVFTANPITGAGAVEDSAYSGSIASRGSDADAGDTMTFSKVSGPSWLSVASNGALTGTPGNSNVGANAFIVKITDAAGANATATLNIAVTNTNDVPLFNTDPIAGTGANEAVGYSGSIAGYASDVDTGDTLTYSKVSGPTWLGVAANGTLSGTPTVSNAGLNAFVVKVTDAAGANDTATLNVTVTAVDSDGVWTNTTGGSWLTAGNWSGGIPASGAGRTADFSTLNLTSNATVTLDASRTIGNLSFGDTTASNTWTLAPGSGGTLTLDVASGAPLITLATGSTATIGVPLAGSDGLTKAGAGTLALTSANSYTGTTTLNAGTLDVSGAAGALPSGGAFTFGGSGTLAVGSQTVTLALAAVDGASGIVTGSGGSLTHADADLKIGGAGAGNRALDLSGLGTFNYNAPTRTMLVGPTVSMSGTGTKGGTLTLAPVSTVTASTIHVGGEVQYEYSTDQSVPVANLYMGHQATFHTNHLYVGQAGGVISTLAFKSGTANPSLTLRGVTGGSSRANITVGNVLDVYTTPTATLDLTAGTTGTSTLDAMVGTLEVCYGKVGNSRPAYFTMGAGTLDATTIRLANVVSSAYNNLLTGTFTAGGGTVKVDSLIFTNDGGTGQAAGVLNLNSGSTLLARSITPGNGATKTFNWNSGTLGNYDSSTDLTLASGITINLGSGTQTASIGNGRTGSIDSVLAGAGQGIVKSGAGTLILTAANTYTGATTVSAGTLRVTGSLAATATTVQSGGTLAGTGSVSGPVSIQSGGTLAPGAGGIGTLTAGNTLSLAGATVMETGKSGSTLSNDMVTGISTLTYGGTLTVTHTGPGALAAGDSFQLFSATSYTGSFSLLSLPSLASGLTWDTSGLAVNGTISVDEALPSLGLGDEADADHDGLNALLEYALGTDPADGRTPMPTLKAGAETLTLAFTIGSPAPADISYVVEGSTNPSDGWTSLATMSGNGAWTWVGGDTSRLHVEALGDRFEVEVSRPDSVAGEARYFLRLRVNRN